MPAERQERGVVDARRHRVQVTLTFAGLANGFDVVPQGNPSLPHY
jgi:hypothetical protein